MALQGIEMEMPMIGLGTWMSLGDTARLSVKTALDVGYRHIDTAFLYENETEIGEVLNEYFTSGKLKREEVFITSKLWIAHLDKKTVRPAFEESLKRLQLDYLDLYLIHAPFGLKHPGEGDWSLFPKKGSDGHLETAVYDLVETWHVLEELVNEKKIRYIGVSNFNSEQIERICKEAINIKPYTNQVECHLYLPQKKLFEFCKERGIILTAYSPFGSPGRKSIVDNSEDHNKLKVLDDKLLHHLATKYKKTPAQIILRNLVQRNIHVIPKSSNPERIKENFEIFDFELSHLDMDLIAGVDKIHRFFAFDNITPHLLKHPEYSFHASS